MTEQELGELWVEAHRLSVEMPVGTHVRYWTGHKGPSFRTGQIRSPFTVQSSGDVVGWVTTHSACIAATHIEKWPGDPEKSVAWTDERVERHTEAAVRSPHVMVHRDFMDGMNERMENLKAENRGLRAAAERNLERIEELTKTADLYENQIRDLQVRMSAFEKLVNEARGVARRYFGVINDAEFPESQQMDDEIARHPWLLGKMP